MKRLLHRWYVRSQAGDTIVEVLISAAVISLVLAGAYAVTNRSTMTITDSREHAQALGIAQGQVEYLRSRSVLHTSGDCFDSDGNEASGTAPCSFATDGSSNCPPSSAWCYRATITPVDGAPVGAYYATYKVAVTWPSSLNNNGEVDLLYRVYQPASVQLGGGGGGGGGGVPPGLPDFGGTPCRNPCTPNPNPTYHFRISRLNVTTTIPDSEIVGCSWDFGDGNPPVNNTACHNGQTVYYTYSGNAPDPYPMDCPGKGGTAKTYTITLTERLSNGSTAQTQHPITVPQCW